VSCSFLGGESAWNDVNSSTKCALPRLAGADASHAWISVWTGSAGETSSWLDLDPTNNIRVGDQELAVRVTVTPLQP
jgi:transglutaminase-like putative cysteine protease